jgi:hypothetical protein
LVRLTFSWESLTVLGKNGCQGNRCKAVTSLAYGTTVSLQTAEVHWSVRIATLPTLFLLEGGFKMRLTQREAENLLTKIASYTKTKEDNIFDAFYHSDLNKFTVLIKDATMTPEEEEAFAWGKHKEYYPEQDSTESPLLFFPEPQGSNS